MHKRTISAGKEAVMPLRHWILVLDASGLLADRGPLSAIAVCRIDEVDADASILGKA